MAQINEKAILHLEAPVLRCAPPDTVIAFGQIEDRVGAKRCAHRRNDEASAGLLRFRDVYQKEGVMWRFRISVSRNRRRNARRGNRKMAVKPGDTVEEDDIIVEVQNDKAVVEVPSPVNGKVWK